MPFRAENVKIGYAKESTFNTAPAAGSMTNWMDDVITYDGLFADIDWKVLYVRGGTREPYTITAGKKVYEGTMNGTVQTGIPIAMMFGVDAVTGTNPYTHTIQPKVNNPHPSWTFEFDYLDTTTLSAYVSGLIPDSLRLTGGETDVLKYSLQCKAGSAVKNAGAQSTITTNTVEPFKFYQGAFTYYGSSIARVVDFEFSASNGGQMFYPYNSASGQNPYEYIMGALNYELKTTVIPNDTSILDELNLVLNNLSFTALFTRGANDTLSLNCTNCVIKQAPHPLPDQGPVKVPMVVTPRNVQVVVVNSTSTSYADTAV